MLHAPPCCVRVGAVPNSSGILGVLTAACRRGTGAPRGDNVQRYCLSLLCCGRLWRHTIGSAWALQLAVASQMLNPLHAVTNPEGLPWAPETSGRTSRSPLGDALVTSWPAESIHSVPVQRSRRTPAAEKSTVPPNK